MKKLKEYEEDSKRILKKLKGEIEEKEEKIEKLISMHNELENELYDLEKDVINIEKKINHLKL
jgi:septal ring factor EnvC (AmiA/AmiB activator)